MRNLLHLEFVFPSQYIDCRGVLTGSVYFIMVKIRIIHMSLALYRLETYAGEDEFIKKKVMLRNAEIMDGAPVRGDHIPIRFYVGNVSVWPFTVFRSSQLSVEHYFRASIVDENGKTYFKKLKVELYRFPFDSGLANEDEQQKVSEE